MGKNPPQNKAEIRRDERQNGLKISLSRKKTRKSRFFPKKIVGLDTPKCCVFLPKLPYVVGCNEGLSLKAHKIDFKEKNA
jgi:hypothetical protein